MNFINRIQMLASCSSCSVRFCNRFIWKANSSSVSDFLWTGPTSGRKFQSFRHVSNSAAQEDKLAESSDPQAATQNQVGQSPSSSRSTLQNFSVTPCPRDFRFVFPDFLPERQFDRRNHKKEIIERNDMLHRRLHIDMPEFYVGSLVAVTVSDPYAAGRKSRFLGLCIQRGGTGLKHHFTLRNCFDGMGVEVRYEMYNPLIQQIEVVKLEKRLDDELYYLRDCLPEYSTFPQDTETVPHTPGAPVPINHIKAELKPSSHWALRWELYEIKGVQPYWLHVTRHRKRRFSKVTAKPWEKYDFMAEYRTGSVREDEEKIYGEMMDFQDKHAVVHRGKKKNIFHHHKAKPQHSES